MSSARDRLVQSAEKNLSRGRLDAALKDYLRLLDDSPKDSFALNKAGDLCVRLGRPADAIGHYARIAELYSGDGFFLKAIAIYKKINKIDPTRLDIYEHLAELYARQGLTQDARAHHQMLAELCLKRNDIPAAIGAYGRMAALDPTDLKTQTRLADLHRVAGQNAEAVARYDAIAALLQRAGAHDEAVGFYRKALDLDPNDSDARLQIARSHLAAGDPSAAVASLEPAERTAEALILRGEAELARGDRAAAIAAAEEALAIEPDAEPARILLARLRLEDGEPDAAFDALTPLVDRARSAGEFDRAAGYLRPLLEAHAAHAGALEKMAEIREAEGDAAESTAMRLALGRSAESRGELEAAAAHYRRILASDPTHAEAQARIAQLAPHPPVRPTDELEVTRPEDAQAAMEEAEVLARYGLKDRAVERLRAVLRRHPDLLDARERLVELMVDLRNPGAPREVDALAEIYRSQGRESLAVALHARLGVPPPAQRAPFVSAPLREAPPPPQAASAPAAVEFDEFEVDLPAAPPAPSAAPFETFESEPAPALAAAPEIPTPPARPTPHAADTAFGLVKPKLGSLIEEKMQRAARESRRTPRPSAPAPVDEENLFADERKFFNLAEELERELTEEPATAPLAPDLSEMQTEASLQDIFREFRKGVEQQLSAEDYETHYNLGIAYKEMGLLDEAIGEFQLASKSPALMVECCSLLGLCFLEKGMPQLAIKWYAKGLATPGIRESDTAGLLYDLARVYQDTGDSDLAYKTFLEVYGINTNYRDVVERVRSLEQVRRNSRESVH